MTRLLGGTLRPIGSMVQLIEADGQRVLDEFRAWREELRQPVRLVGPKPFDQALDDLLPFQAPWTRDLVVGCGRWTAYLNNFIGGGDPTSGGIAVARRLGVRWVMAQHAPRYGPGHAATQLWIHGADGASRSVAAVATDGRWEWLEHGAPLPFEQLERYTRRLKRERLDRALLLTYLDALDVDLSLAEQSSATVTAQVVGYSSRTLTLDEARRDA